MWCWADVEEAMRGSHFHLLWPWIALLWLHLSVAAAQTASPRCDTSLRAIADATGYRARAGDPRCEGVFESPVSVTELEVVSVTVGALSFDIDVHHEVVVAPPDLKGLNAKAVNVRAVALPLRTYYRMDAVLAPGEIFHWPLAAVVR